MKGLLLDTHVWFWFLVGSDRLSRPLRDALSRRGRERWLSPVSVWELAMLARKGRVQIDGEYRAWVRTAFERMPVREAPLNHEIAIRSEEVDLASLDPADRFLAATALVFDLTLVTVDRHLVAADWLPTLPAS